MPVVSVWVMPMGLLGADRHAVRLRRPVLAADGRRHRLDDRGRAVGREPAGRGRPHARRSAPGRCCSAPPGSCVLCLLRSPLRWSGGVLVVVASAVGGRARRCRMCWSPPTAQALAVRGADGRLADRIAPAATPSPSRNGSPPTAMRDCPTTRRWARAFRCDAAGCIARLADGRLVVAGHRARGLRGGLRARRGRGHEPRGAAATARRW